MHKNNDKSLTLKTEIEEGFYVMRFQNDSPEVVRETQDMSSNYIQFHFCTKGTEISFLTKGITVSLLKKKIIFFFLTHSVICPWI